MRHDALRIEKVGRFTVELHHDEDPESPREWDNLGTIAAWHRRYSLGDKNGTRPAGGNQDLEPEEFNEWLTAHPEVISLPVYMYDHSGICLSTGSFSCPWDSGQLGIIYITPEKLAKEFEGHPMPDRAAVEKMLAAEVATYSAYVEGRVYGFIVKDAEGETIESCWGFIGDDDEALKEGMSLAQYHEDKAVAAEAMKFPVANWMIGAKP